MGISGLLRFVKDATDSIHIKKYSGQVVAVDTYCWIHRGSFACADKLAKNEHTNQYVNYCMKFIDMLESFHVKPVLVFDGCRLPSKELVEQERYKRRKENLEKGKKLLREGKIGPARDCFTKCISVTPAMALRVIEAARARGVDCVVAPYEADAQLAYFSKTGIAQAVITEDSDLLCFGCKTVIFKMDMTGRAQEVSINNLNRVKNLQGFTPDLFRHMCILSGCDYLPSVKGVGLAKACKALKLSKSRNSYQVAAKLHQYIKGLSPVDFSYGVDFIKADKTFLYQLVFNTKTRKLQPLNEYPQNIEVKDLEFAGPYIPDDTAFQIALGNIDINTKLVIGYFDIDKWLSNRKPMDPHSSIWDGTPVKTVIPKSTQVFIHKNSSSHEINDHIASKVSKAVTGESSAKKKTPQSEFHYQNPAANEEEAKLDVFKDILQTYSQSSSAASKPKALVHKKVVKSRFFLSQNSSESPKDFETQSEEAMNHSNSLFSDNRSNEDTVLTEILSEISNQRASSPVMKRHLSEDSNTSVKRKKSELSSGEGLERFSYRRKKKKLPNLLPNDVDVNRTYVPNNCDEAIPLLDGCHVSTSLFGFSPSYRDTNIPDENSDENIPVLDGNHETSNFHSKLDTAVDENGLSPKARTPLAVLASENECVLVSGPSAAVCSSNEKAELSKRRLGLPAKGNFKSPVKLNLSKYFSGSKASGLRKKKKSSSDQPSIMQFFKMNT